MAKRSSRRRSRRRYSRKRKQTRLTVRPGQKRTGQRVWFKGRWRYDLTPQAIKNIKSGKYF